MTYRWCGRDIESLSREELIKAVQQLIVAQQAAFDRSRQVFESWRMCREARKERV